MFKTFPKKLIINVFKINYIIITYEINVHIQEASIQYLIFLNKSDSQKLILPRSFYVIQ